MTKSLSYCLWCMCVSAHFTPTQYLYLSDKDVGLLLLYQTQSLLSTDFSIEVRVLGGQRLHSSNHIKRFITYH